MRHRHAAARPGPRTYPCAVQAKPTACLRVRDKKPKEKGTGKRRKRDGDRWVTVATRNLSSFSLKVVLCVFVSASASTSASPFHLLCIHGLHTLGRTAGVCLMQIPIRVCKPLTRVSFSCCLFLRSWFFLSSFVYFHFRMAGVLLARGALPLRMAQGTWN